jgi:hypothetical protein
MGEVMDGKCRIIEAEESFIGGKKTTALTPENSRKCRSC